MSKRWWLLGVTGLILVGLLVACGSNYSLNSSSNGLLLVGSQGAGVIETFSISLNDGHIAAIANSPGSNGTNNCVLGGLPSSIVSVPGGAYAYAIINKNVTNCGGSSTTGVATFQISSDGKISQMGNLQSLLPETVLIQGTTTSEQVPVVPGTLAMDPAGKFVFVADRATTDSSGLHAPGAVSVFAIGSGGALAEVSGSPFFVVNPATTTPQANFDIAGVAPTPTVFPAVGINGVQNSVCQAPGTNPPTSQFLYAVDAVNYLVWEFSVNMTTGALGNPPGATAASSFATDTLPLGVAVDPCDRFVYVSDNLTNKVSAYTICTQVQLPGPCLNADGSLVAVAGSPFSLTGSATAPGPLLVDPFGNNVYVLGTTSNTVSGFKISPVSGALTAITPATIATGHNPKSIAIRGDDTWMFVANFDDGTVSQYSITPATGALSASPSIQTDNQPWGVAVK